MNTYEINDPDAARRYLLQSMGLSRLARLSPARATDALHWALEIASEGLPVPLLGLVCDVGHLMNRGHVPSPVADASGKVEEDSDEPDELPTAIDRVDRALVRRYEDYVLGKLYADLTVERAIDALQRYQGRERTRAIAFALKQVCQRCGLGGAIVGPAVIKGLLALNTAELTERFESIQQFEFDQGMLEEFEQLIQCVRNTGELLGPEDIFELERGTALAHFGQRIALRQVLQAAQFLSIDLPSQKPRGAARQYSVATNICQEDFYPVGGFTSISNRGTLESLLRSELAYMDVDQRPDLFDVKYVRDELLYYARDDNRFFRRRVCYMFVMPSELVAARVKDPGSQWQRIIYVLAILVVAVRSLTEWLSADALRFEILLVAKSDEQPLADERLLLETIFHEEIRAGSVELVNASHRELLERCQHNAKQSLCHCTITKGSRTAEVLSLLVPARTGKETIGPALPLMSILSVAGKLPTVEFDDSLRSFDDQADPWRAALACLLEAWL